MYLADGMRRPRVAIKVRKPEIRSSDLRVGVRVIALCNVEGIQAFTSGEIAEVIEVEPAEPVAPAEPAPPAPPAPPAAPGEAAADGADGAGGGAAAPAQAGGPRWQVESDSGWSDFEAATQTQLVEAAAASVERLTFERGRYTYGVDLTAMTQTNTHTGKVRAVRVQGVAPVPPAPPAPPPQLLIQWDTIGKSSTIGAADVNLSFTALHMRDRLMNALKLIQDLSHSEYELPDEDLSATLTAVLAGKRVDPELQEYIDDEKITYEDVEIVLSQADVKGTLLPAVKEEWGRLYGAVVAQELGTAELHRRFHTMDSEMQRETEIRLLAATGHGCVDEAGAKDDWVPLVLSKISAFILCEGCQNWIPGISQVREMCADLFDTTAEDDESLKRLQAFVQTMSEAWATEHLSTVDAIFEPIRDACAWSQTTRMDFFAALSQTDALVSWLLEHADTDAFNSLLQVCRPRTEDPLLLKAIASLVHVRTILLDLLYVDQPYVSLAHMLERVGRIDMARGTSLQHLLNVQQSFDGLLELFEKETRSPGISSCYELDEIRREGVFVLTATEDADKVLMLRLVRFAYSCKLFVISLFVLTHFRSSYWR